MYNNSKYIPPSDSEVFNHYFFFLIHVSLAVGDKSNVAVEQENRRPCHCACATWEHAKLIYPICDRTICQQILRRQASSRQQHLGRVFSLTRIQAYLHSYMELWTFLLCVGLSYAAPVNEQNGEIANNPNVAEVQSVLVKRAQEAIMFGNQQNAPKMKRSDPNVPTLADDNGGVRALPPQEVSEEDASSESKPEPTLLEDLNNKVNNGEEEVESENTNEDISENNEEMSVAEGGDNIDEQEEDSEKEANSEVIEEILTPTDEKAVVDSESDTEKSVEVAQEDAIPELNEQPESDDDYDDYLWRWLEVLPENNRRNQDYPEGYYNGYYPRYRSQQQRLVDIQPPMLKPGGPIEREVKRSHRTKRDLLFPDDETDPYYLTPADVSEALYGDAQEQLPEYSDPYYDLVEEEEEAAPTFSNDIEEDEMESDIRPIMYQGQPGYFVPAKRSDFLSFVPGNKRDQYFYPYSEEPQTHWGAFIPSKRDYTDSYANLVRLARRLAVRENPREFKEYRRYNWE
ncbi:hypothetical protein ScPMuIL_013171 [Solemya velum]